MGQPWPGRFAKLLGRATIWRSPLMLPISRSSPTMTGPPNCHRFVRRRQGGRFPSPVASRDGTLLHGAQPAGGVLFCGGGSLHRSTLTRVLLYSEPVCRTLTFPTDRTLATTAGPALLGTIRQRLTTTTTTTRLAFRKAAPEMAHQVRAGHMLEEMPQGLATADSSEPQIWGSRRKSKTSTSTRRSM